MVQCLNLRAAAAAVAQDKKGHWKEAQRERQRERFNVNDFARAFAPLLKIDKSQSQIIISTIKKGLIIRLVLLLLLFSQLSIN